MSKHERPHKRQSYFVQREFQLKFILKFCILLLIGIVISTGLLLLFSRGTLTSSFEQSRLTIEDTASAILPVAVYVNLVTLGLISLAAIGVTLFVSHKLAGPLFRYERELNQIGSGDLTKDIQIRKNDQIRALASSLNQMTASLHEKVLLIRKDVEELLEFATDHNAPQDLVEQISQLHEKIGINFKL